MFVAASTAITFIYSEPAIKFPVTLSFALETTSMPTEIPTTVLSIIAVVLETVVTKVMPVICQALFVAKFKNLPWTNVVYVNVLKSYIVIFISTTSESVG